MDSETAQNRDPLSESIIQEVYREYELPLRRFLVGLLRDAGMAEDAFQNTMGKLIAKGHTANPDSIKPWLFQVAYNEAMMLRRKTKNQLGLIERAAWTIDIRTADRGETGESRLLQQERIANVRAAIEKLPREQQIVLRKRIYENIKFKDIAAELQLPLGTVLSRMHMATKSLKNLLTDPEDD